MNYMMNIFLKLVDIVKLIHNKIIQRLWDIDLSLSKN